MKQRQGRSRVGLGETGESVGEGKGIPPSQEALAQVEQLKATLNLLAKQLSFFRDGPREVRAVYRREMKLHNVGYLSSLLGMLADECKFQRWKLFTSIIFRPFRAKKEGK